MIIAVDGPAASGKGTIARKLASFFGFHYLDTGSLYRAVALEILKSGHDITDLNAALNAAQNLNSNTLDDPALRDSTIGEAASIVAGMAEIRDALLKYQRNFAVKRPGAILDGRDIATVVCPDADIKLFITASIEERARRRHRELSEKNPDLSYNYVIEHLRRRDERDSSRAVAPLKKADDAYLIDTTNLDIEAAYKAAVDIINAVDK